MDNFRIILQFCGDIRWNHIIYDVNEGRFVSNKACRILIVVLKGVEDDKHFIPRDT